MVGKVVSHYRVVRTLGVGGMGVVYEAQDERLPRRVALKFLSDELAGDPDASRRLKREAQIISLLSHPHICTIYEIDEHKGDVFIAMERLEGTNLKVFMARHALDTAEILDIALQVTDALEAAHGRGIIHRDIKPGNIFVGGDRRVKVLDFGLARRVRMPVRRADGRIDHHGATAWNRQLHGARANPAAAARSALRSVFSRRRDLRDGYGEAAVHRRFPR